MRVQPVHNAVRSAGFRGRCNGQDANRRAFQEVVVISRALVFLGCVVLVAACDSSTPTAPATRTVTPTSPTPTSTRTGPFGAMPSIRITAGTMVEGVISGTDPVCFPDWDAAGHCHEYDLVMPTDGLLVATLTWAGPSRGLYDPDLFLATPGGGWLYSEDSWPQKRLSMRATSGSTVSLAVLSYGTSEQSFQLLAQVEH